MHDNVNIVSTEQKLLFDIRELLIEQNKLLNRVDNVTLKPLETANKVEGEIIPEVINEGLECPLCGGDHSNVGKRLACLKKTKNKGR